nr:hypothetical protein CFP56_24050 [Quercus suber]
MRAHATHDRADIAQSSQSSLDPVGVRETRCGRLSGGGPDAICDYWSRLRLKAAGVLGLGGGGGSVGGTRRDRKPGNPGCDSGIDASAVGGLVQARPLGRRGLRLSSGTAGWVREPNPVPGDTRRAKVLYEDESSFDERASRPSQPASQPGRPVGRQARRQPASRPLEDDECCPIINKHIMSMPPLLRRCGGISWTSMSAHANPVPKETVDGGKALAPLLSSF